MKALVRAIVFLPIAAILIGFALANRGAVTILIDPLGLVEPPIAYTLPLFLPIFLALILGVVLGGIAMWFSEGRHRRAAKLHLRDLERQRRDLEELRRTQAQPPLPPAPMIG
jgi:hypothetical protein